MTIRLYNNKYFSLSTFSIHVAVLSCLYLSGAVHPFNVAYSQEETEKSESSSTSTNSTKIPGYSEFVGFDKDFSLQYPTDWTAEPKANRFENLDVTLSKPQSGVITVTYSTLPAYIIESMKEDNLKQKDVVENLDKFFPAYVNSYTKGLTDAGGSASEIEEPAYDKYTVDGHKVGSSVLSISNLAADKKLGSLILMTIIGKNRFDLTYTAPEDQFDQNLPIAENVIQSIKFLK